MVETISPVGHGTRARWLGSLALHAVGAAATATAFGAAVAAAGALLGAPWGRAGALAVLATGVAYAARELVGLPIPVPQLRRQVPDWWRTYFGRPVAAVLYGAGLGVGFLTFLGHGTLVVVSVGVAATGRPAIGAIAMAPFGLARGIAPLVSARSRQPEDGRRLVERLSSSNGRLRSLLNAAAALAVAGVAGVGAWASHGGWSGAAAAALAIAFAWASGSKIVATSRWRPTLRGHRLPPRLEEVALWAVPIVEAQVPLLTVVGRERAAAGVTLAALALFSMELVRTALRTGRRVPCGCFGRSAVDVRLALGRNLLLACLALASWFGSRPDEALVLPSGPDALPAVLAAGALVAAAGTVWRASVWFARGRG